jgi:hypothetical protein
MGRVYHRLLAEAKYLGTYYTSVSAATLLLKLALDPDRWPGVGWDSPAEVGRLRVGDLACGTGTLLMAAVQAAVDNHVLQAAARGRPPDLAGLHRTLIEEVVWGYDVLASAVHLTAATLALLAPEVVFGQMRLFVLPLGGPQHRLGSIEFLEGPRVAVGGYLFGPAPQALQVTGEGSAPTEVGLPEGGFDLVAMNPPFTRSVGGNLLFGSRPAPERQRMQRRLAELLRRRKVRASATAGLGSVFVAVADRALKDGGRQALVLPRTVLTGVAWDETRKLLAEGYVVEYVVVSHEPGRWNFSENTDLSEALLVARKGPDEGASAETVWVNLTRNPRNVTEALALADAVRRSVPPPLSGPGVGRLRTDGQEWGEIFRVRWADFKDGLWFLGSFARTELNRAAFELIKDRQLFSRPVPLRRLGDLFELGPDRRDIHDGFTRGKAPSSYPAFWDHDSDRVRTLALAPNAYLVPRTAPAAGRPLRDAGLLWGRAGRLLIAERLWLNTHRLTAGRTDKPVLGNVWWPCRPREGVGPAEEKALCLWLNSTPGLIVLLAHRTETRGAWVEFKKPTLENMPVPDLKELGPAVTDALAGAFDRLKDRELGRLPELAQDPVRAEIDGAVEAALGLPPLGGLRELLAREPIVCLGAG